MSESEEDEEDYDEELFYSRDDLLVTKVTPLGLQLISNPEIRNCCDYQNYLFDVRAIDRNRKVVKRCEEHLTHKISDLKLKMDMFE